MATTTGEVMAVQKDAGTVILTINGGSSSIKFAVFTAAAEPRRLISGEIERVGSPDSQLSVTVEDGRKPDKQAVKAGSFEDGAQSIIDYLRDQLGQWKIGGIGHRIVHGGLKSLGNQLITPATIADLRQAQALDLTHLPREIALIESFLQAFPSLPQVACFDTVFHHDLPRVAQILPIPRKYFEAGVRRFGFHGLSYTYLMKQLATVAGKDAAEGRIILAHLGSGASMAAVHHGKPVDTTMAFTPTAGLVMGTRPGDLDPGLLIYLMKQEKLSPDEMDQFISQKCGLLGVSETSSDMRDLVGKMATDARAADAVNLFCYQARKFIGAFFAAMSGVDTLVFAGGIGEHSPTVRAKICEGLDCLGIVIDQTKNDAGQDVISSEKSRVILRVIPTDEEIVIAGLVLPFVQL